VSFDPKLRADRWLSFDGPGLDLGLDRCIDNFASPSNSKKLIITIIIINSSVD